MDFKEKVEKILKNHVDEIILEIPPNDEMGDFAFPCFNEAKKRKKSPTEIASELVKEIKLEKPLKKIEAKGPYVNFFLDKAELAKEVLTKVEKLKDKYGQLKDNEKVLIEYFQSNTHKGVHIGHIRNVSMGEALARVLEKAGKKVYRANYQGDIGPHVAKCLWAYTHLDKIDEKEPDTMKGMWLGKIYSKAHQLSKEDPKVEEEIREINNKIYSKDKEVLKIWKKTRKYCLDDFNEFYKEFQVKFDKLYFESETEEIGKKIVLDLLDKGIAKKDEGAIIMDLKEYNLGVFVLLTSDGNPLYSTKDLGLANVKAEHFDIDHNVYVVGSEQEHHFNQLFKTLEIMDHKLAKKSKHLSYGLVMLPEGKMSSRDGTMVMYYDLKQELMRKAEEEIKKRHEGINANELVKRVKDIAFGALKFGMVNREFRKDIVFDWETAVDFEGETGPYCQYTYARASSILAKGKLNKKIDYRVLEKNGKLIKLMNKFPEVIKESSEVMKPHLVARYCIDLCQAFNEFYQNYKVLDEEDVIRDARLMLVHSFRQVLKNALEIIGVPIIEKM